MKNSMNWKYVFQVKAVINWVESLLLLFADGWIRSLLNEKPLANPEYLQMLMLLVIVLGIGYWWVGNDTSRDRDIVKLGIYGQCSVFLVLAYHTLAGNLHPFYLIPGIIDLVFAILFTVFLYSENKPALE